MRDKKQAVHFTIIDQISHQTLGRMLPSTTRLQLKQITVKWWLRHSYMQCFRGFHHSYIYTIKWNFNVREQSSLEVVWGRLSCSRQNKTPKAGLWGRRSRLQTTTPPSSTTCKLLSLQSRCNCGSTRTPKVTTRLSETWSYKYNCSDATKNDEKNERPS